MEEDGLKEWDIPIQQAYTEAGEQSPTERFPLAPAPAPRPPPLEKRR